MREQPPGTARRAVSVETFLRQRAVRIEAQGIYTLPNWYDPQGRLRSFACRTMRVSPFRMLVDVPVVGKVGDRLTSYFRDFGKFEGHISDITNGSFLLELEMTRAMRVRLADKLVWLERKLKDPASVREERNDARYIPSAPRSTLTWADGSVTPCFIIDFSAAGVSVSSGAQPSLGTPLAIGACIGRVVRLSPEGFAVKLLGPAHNLQDLERRLIRHMGGPVANANGRVEQFTLIPA
jgi:hypothetical protein